MASTALERVRKRTERATAAKEKSGSWRAFTRPALLLGAASTVLTLLGYGAARCNDAMFGLSYALWFETPLDLMAMSGDTFIGLFDASTKMLGSMRMWRNATVAAGMLASMVLATLTALWLWTSPQAKPLRERGASCLRRSAIWLFTPRERFQDHLAHATFTAAAAGVIGGISALSGLLLLPIALAAICSVPVVGFLGASVYARAAIVEPPSCISPLEVRLHAKWTTVGAPCVQVTDPATGKSAVGRLILARGSRIFLYSKEEDRAYMFTIKDALISTVHGAPQESQTRDLDLVAHRE